MSSDLISRSAVIRLIESKCVDGCLGTDDTTLIDAYELLDDVSELPTAYDADKAVEQLELHKACYEKKAAEYDEIGDTQNMDISDLISLAYGKTIEIIKAGGIS